VASVDVGGPRFERERICAALIDLVAERGYHSISLEDLLDRADVNHAGFARHFNSLEECFAAAWDDIDVELSRCMTAAYESGEEWQERLREALLAGLRYFAAEPGRATFYIQEALYVNDDLRRRQQTALTRLSSMVDRGRGDPDGTPSRYIADAISGAIWYRVEQLVRTGKGGELPGEVSQLMYLAVLPYRGPAAAEAELRRPMRR
jgi:AcrR family transcriptional regulator